MWIELTRDLLGQKAGQRIDVEPGDGQVLIDAGSARACADPTGDLVGRALGEAMGKLTDSLNTAVEGALKAFAEAQTKSLRARRALVFGAGGDGDPERPTFGKFLLAVRDRDTKALEAMGSHFVAWEAAEQKGAWTTATGSAGGFAVPPEFHARVMEVVSERSLVRPRATVVPMAGRTLQVPALDVTTAPTAGDSAMLGGLVARWTEEAATLTESEPALRMVELTNHELSAYTKVSHAMLADAGVGLDAFLTTLFARAVAWYEDYAFLRGNGVGKPLGVLAWPGLISVTRSGASAFTAADAAGMYARLLPDPDPRTTCWLMQPTLFAKALQVTQGGVNLTLDARGKPTYTLMGLPVAVTEKLPALNTAGDVLLCDFAHYLVGDRQQLEVAYSDHAAFLTNQAVWRFVSRVGGQPWMKAAITLADATTTVAPFVALAAG